jgi:hypothetical protein
MKNVDRSSYDEKLEEDIQFFQKVLDKKGETDNKSQLQNELFQEYVDPDKYTEWVINDIRFGADGICGLKYWIKYYNKPFNREWIEEFRKMRSRLLIWPRHVQSINQRRMSCYKDRLDYALWDIEKYWASIDSKLIRPNTNTEKWIQKMKKKYNGAFTKFITDELDLGFMLNEEGKVMNLETEEMRPFKEDDKFILNGECYSRYLENMLKRL